MNSIKRSWSSLDIHSQKTAYRPTHGKLKMWSIFRRNDGIRNTQPAGDDDYCSRFIPGYATKTEPLRKLTHKNQPWCWTAEHDRAVSELKEAPASAPITAYFDPEKDTEISVDASPVGLAAILAQVDPKTKERQVITYGSRSLTATEREALAITWACEPLHLYVYRKPVTVYTDYKPLVSIYNNPNSKPPARIKRWALRFQPYQITVKYRKGDVNPADY